MPTDSPIFGITSPCVGEDITVASLVTYASDVESALASVEPEMTKALMRPAVRVQNTIGTPYTAGVAVVPSYNVEIVDTDNMFDPATPTIFTVNTAGVYLINFYCSTNMVSTNTSHRGEILINGAAVASQKGGPGSAVVGWVPINPFTLSTLASLSAGNTISGRITVTGVGNSSTFPSLSAALVSYGGF